MSQLNTKKVKFGDNQDLSKNFVMYVPAVADGTFTFAREDGTVIWQIPSSGGGTGTTVNGSLTFTGAAPRIIGDFSNPVQSQRLLFQTSTVNGNTLIGAIPNGTARRSQYTAFGNSDPTNCSVLSMSVDENGGAVGIDSNKNGSGTYLSMLFSTGGLERFRLSATENRFQADFSNATIANRLMFQNVITNATTEVGFLPNGTGTMSQLNMYGSNDTVNHSVMRIGCNSAAGICNINSGATGTGPILPMVFQTGGIERMRLQSNGDFTFGNVTSVAAIRYFDICNVDSSMSSAIILRFLTQQAGSATTTTADISKAKNGSWQFNTYEPGSNGYLSLGTNGAERMRINQDGGIGFWTASAGVPGIPAGKFFAIGDGDTGIGWEQDGILRFYGNNVTSVRITGTNLQVPGTGFASNQDSFSLGAGGNARNWAMAGASNMHTFWVAGATVGTIACGASSTAYNTTSDHRLKKNVRAIVDPLVRLLRIKPVAFNWRVDDSEGEGFIAHELQEEYPLAVTGEKDAVKLEDDETGKAGDIIPQGVDLSKLVPLLVAAVQELAHEVAMLKAGV